MDVTVERTLFLLDFDTMEITICTWQGEEANLPVSHLLSLVDYVRASGVRLPPSPPVVLTSVQTGGMGNRVDREEG